MYAGQKLLFAALLGATALVTSGGISRAAPLDLLLDDGVGLRQPVCALQDPNGIVYRSWECTPGHPSLAAVAPSAPGAGINWGCFTITFSGVTVTYNVPPDVRFVRVNILGDDNKITFAQTDPTKNILVVGITGNRDTVTADQIGGAKRDKARIKSIPASTVTVEQDGTKLNLAVVRQQGAPSTATIGQHGHGAVQRAKIVQGLPVHIDTSCPPCGAGTGNGGIPVDKGPKHNDLGDPHPAVSGGVAGGPGAGPGKGHGRHKGA